MHVFVSTDRAVGLEEGPKDRLRPLLQRETGHHPRVQLVLDAAVGSGAADGGVGKRGSSASASSSTSRLSRWHRWSRCHGYDPECLTPSAAAAGSCAPMSAVDRGVAWAVIEIVWCGCMSRSGGRGRRRLKTLEARLFNASSLKLHARWLGHAPWNRLVYTHSQLITLHTHTQSIDRYLLNQSTQPSGYRALVLRPVDGPWVRRVCASKAYMPPHATK